MNEEADGMNIINISLIGKYIKSFYYYFFYTHMNINKKIASFINKIKVIQYSPNQERWFNNLRMTEKNVFIYLFF